jgi:hypothetical protein
MIHRTQDYPKISRNGDYELFQKNKELISKFESINYPEGTETNGSIQSMTNIRLYQQINAPFLLATLCATFEGLKIKTMGQSGYKCTWEIVLLYKPSKSQNNLILTFYDYKGGASYGSNLSNYGDLALIDCEFIHDVRELIWLIINDRFPHPYDSCVIGEQA